MQQKLPHEWYPLNGDHDPGMHHVSRFVCLCQLSSPRRHLSLIAELASHSCLFLSRFTNETTNRGPQQGRGVGGRWRGAPVWPWGGRRAIRPSCLSAKMILPNLTSRDQISLTPGWSNFLNASAPHHGRIRMQRFHWGTFITEAIRSGWACLLLCARL